MNGVENALKNAINWTLLGPYLKKNRDEVKDVLLTEFNQQEYEETIRRESFEEGIEIGVENVIKTALNHSTAEDIAKCLAIPLEKIIEIKNKTLITE